MRLTTSALLLRHYPGAELSHFNNQDDYFQLLYATLQQVVSNTHNREVLHTIQFVCLCCVVEKPLKMFFIAADFMAFLKSRAELVFLL